MTTPTTRRRVRAALVCLAAALLSASWTTPAAAQGYVPGAEWDVVPAAELADRGWSEDGLRETFAFVRDSSWMTGVIAVHDGRIVFQFGDVSELSYLASVRKSVLAMLYGPHVERGVIDLDETLADLHMDDVQGLLPIERSATVGHLVTARSGVYHPASNPGDNLAAAPERGSQAPGTYMLYSNWDFNAAGAVFEQKTGVSIYDALQAQLAIPLQFQDWDRGAQRKSGDPTRSRNLAYHMWLSTRDMARVGLLMLREGRWGNAQVLSTDWVRRISSVVTPLEEMNPRSRRDGYFGYGFMWWVFDGPRVSGPFEGAYTARGAVGQWITVFPALDLVVAVKTNSAYRRTTTWDSWHRMLELLLPSHESVASEVPFPWDAEVGGR